MNNNISESNIQLEYLPSTSPSSSKSQFQRASNILIWTAKSWFLTAAIGQWLFVSYIVAFYGGSTLSGDFESWNSVLPGGYIPGDTSGNLAIGLHVLISIVIIGGGPLQLIPQIRRSAPRFHRILGRIYIPSAMLTSIAGLYMTWFRDKDIGDVTMDLGLSLDAVLILIFSVLTVKYAMDRQLITHRKWALRLFMVVNAVWFFRIGLMFWMFINSGPVGFDKATFTGPFLTFWVFAQYLIPLAVLEFYFIAREGKKIVQKYSASALVFLCTLCTGVGTFVAFMGMWLPRM